MQLRFHPASGPQVFSPLPHPCLSVHPEKARAWISATVDSWTLLSVASPVMTLSLILPAQPSPWPHPEGDESQPVILSMNDFLHDDLHTVVHHLLLRPVLSAFLQGPRAGCIHSQWPPPPSLPSAPPGPAGQDTKGQQVCSQRALGSNAPFEPQVPHLENGSNTYFEGLFWGFD